MSEMAIPRSMRLYVVVKLDRDLLIIQMSVDDEMIDTMADEELIIAFALGFVVWFMLKGIFTLKGVMALKKGMVLLVGFLVYLFTHWIADHTGGFLGMELHIEPLLICIVGSFLVTRGVKGADLYHEGEKYWVGTHLASEIDPTGAGDCFASGFMYALATGRSVQDAARLGAAAVPTHPAAAQGGQVAQ